MKYCVLLLLSLTLPVWAQTEAAVQLSFAIEGKVGEHSLETRPRVLTLEGKSCEIAIGQDEEEPVEWVRLEVTPTLVQGGRVELVQRLLIQVGERKFERKVKLVSLLGVPATIEFQEDDLELKLTVTASLQEAE